MKKTLLSALLFGAISFTNAQTSLYSENFEATGSSITMNTTDVSSTTTGHNSWVRNNVYAGGSGTSSCFGFAFTIGTTPAQPAGITNSPNSTYMHILSADGTNNTILNANYSPSDGGLLCFGDENYFSGMSSDISTVGYDSVELSLWWMCGGSPTAYGEIYYSTNGGSTWTSLVSNLNSTPTWTQDMFTDAQLAGQATLRFGFRYVNLNDATGSAAEPSFSIDDIEVTGFVNAPSNSISTDNVSGTTLCPEGTYTVDYTATGTYTAGNNFNAELSDASGSFASATVIGTTASTSSGSINVTIPGGTGAGTAYRIRVVSDNPATTGSDNGANLTVHNVDVSTSVSGITASATATGATYQWIDCSTMMAISGETNQSYTASANGDYAVVVDDGTCSDTSACVNITGVGIFEATNDFKVSAYPNPVNDLINLTWDEYTGLVSIKVTDVQGRILHRMSGQNGTAVINFESYESGIYYLKIEGGQKQAAIKLIKL